MEPLFGGLVVVSGEHDSGKTVFSLTTGVPPEETVFVNADIKGKDVNDQIQKLSRSFAQYHDLVHDTAGMLELAYHDHCMKLISGIPAGVKVIVWDTWNSFETTFQPYVLAHQNQFRASWSSKGDIHGAQIWQSSFDLETQVIDTLLQKCGLLILTTYLKDESINGKKSGKQIPDGKKPLIQKSQMRLFLRHNPESPAPIGLVLKRIARFEVNEMGGIEAVSVLPRKINPCTWEKIRWYWENPVGDRPLLPEEKPDEYELSLLDGTLTEDQKMVLKLTPVDEEEESSIPTTAEDNPEIIAQVKALKGEGKTIKDIMAITSLRLPAVMKILK